MMLFDAVAALRRHRLGAVAELSDDEIAKALTEHAHPENAVQRVARELDIRPSALMVPTDHDGAPS